MLLTLALMSLFSAAQPSLPRSDLSRIFDAVITSVAPDSGRIGQRPARERPLVVDQEASFGEFDKVVTPGDVSPRTLSLRTPFSVAKRADAIRCQSSSGDGDCSVVHDGLFLSLTDFAMDTARNELTVHAFVAWTSAIKGTSHLDWFDMELFLARQNGQWRVVRKGKAAVG